MQFNRNKYLVSDFDLDNEDEIKNAYYAQQYKGLDWNNYIKNYVIKCLSDAIGTYGFEYKDIQDFIGVGEYINFGLFIQAANYLDSLETDNENLKIYKALWSERLSEADDYQYQLSQDPNYQTFTIKEMIKSGTYNDYLEQTKTK